MRLPDSIERAIDREATGAPGKALAAAAEALSARYRDRADRSDAAGRETPHALTDLERLAYAIVRAPATYAAVAAVLDELRLRAPDLRVASLLDLGAGTGAATWATLAQRDDVEQVTLIEQDRGFIALGRRILNDALPAMASRTDWQCADLAAAPSGPLPAHDLVIASYALGEIRDRAGARTQAAALAGANAASGADAISRFIARAWSATRQALIVIEPGTPDHFAGVLAARDYLIREGAFILAPCPHADACPMAGVDWCHMPARVERTSLHRRLKGAALPYEDEKFSYVIATRTPATRAAARIVRRPEIQKGFIALTLCTPEGLRREGVTRSQREAFRRARKASWGDAF